MINWIKKMLHRYHRMITYGFMGVINTGVEYSVFYLLYRLAGLPIESSQALGYLCGSVSGYFLNSNVTFREGKGRTHAQFIQYVGLDLALATISSVVMGVVERRGLPILPLKILVTACITLIHYVVYKYFVFRIKKEDEQ